uniref:ZP domain-containing protein n=1 Tax=Parascaris equorum TaxID=6256 RepID=A0A914RET7_PAREQ
MIKRPRMFIATVRMRCALQLNPKGAMFETSVILKFHPYYNTHKDKVFTVQCFYPEKASKVPKKLLNNSVAISDR